MESSFSFFSFCFLCIPGFLLLYHFKAWSDGQYIHFLLSCLQNGKFIISRPEIEYDDILIDEQNCIMVDDFSSNKLGHLIHFFINFQEEILAISENAKKFMLENHSKELNNQSIKKIYNLQQT